MRQRHEAEAARMRQRAAKAAYIREGKRGWKRRRAEWESRQRQIVAAPKVSRAQNVRIGAKGMKRTAQQLRTDQQKKAIVEYESLETEAIKPLSFIRPSVDRATVDELIAAGWGDYERWRIPEDWQTRQPTTKFPPASAIKLTRKATNQPPAPTDSRKLA